MVLLKLAHARAYNNTIGNSELQFADFDKDKDQQSNQFVDDLNPNMKYTNETPEQLTKASIYHLKMCLTLNTVILEKPFENQFYPFR